MQHLQNNRGFSLPEVLMTIVILSVGFLAMASMTTGIMRSNAFSSRVTTATALAQEKMEETLGLGYPALPAGSHRTSEDYGNIPRYPIFKRIVQTQDLGVPSDGMKVISVVVYWGGDAHVVRLKTIIGE